MIYIMLAMMSAASFCQKTNDSVPVVKTDYLAKSKSQKTAAFILLGIGVTTLTIASVADLDLDAVGAVVVVGGAATIASIPLFIASGKNKKKARNITTNIKMEKATIFEKQFFVQSSYPAVTFKISL